MQRPEAIKITAALMVIRLCIGVIITVINPPWNAANIHPKGHATVAGTMHAIQIIYATALVVAFVTTWCYWLGNSGRAESLSLPHFFISTR